MHRAYPMPFEECLQHFPFKVFGVCSRDFQRYVKIILGIICVLLLHIHVCIYIYIHWKTHCLLNIWKSKPGKPVPKPMICGAGRVAEQGGWTLRLLICGAGRVAEQGGWTLRLLICGAGRVAEQGGRTVRLLICGAGKVA